MIFVVSYSTIWKVPSVVVQEYMGQLFHDTTSLRLGATPSV
jgi:hypothetical protein